MGDARPFDARPVRHRLFLMPLDFGPGQRLAVVLRVRSSGAINIPLSLHSGASAIGWAQDHGLSQGMFLGALAMLALFNAALYLRLRIRQSLYNTAYILCAGLFLTSMSGLSFQYLWPDWPWLANRSVPLTETLAILSLLWFTRHFLAIDAGRWPRQARLMRLLAWIGAGLLAASLLVPYSLIIKIDTVYALACMVAMFGLGLRHPGQFRVDRHRRQAVIGAISRNHRSRGRLIEPRARLRHAAIETRFLFRNVIVAGTPGQRQ